MRGAAAAGCGRARPRPGRHRDGLLRRRLARARGRHDGHRVAQPEAVHRDEARPPRRAAGRRRVRACSTSATARGQAGVRGTRCAATVTEGSAELTTSGPPTSSGCCRSWTCRRSSRCKVVIDAANGMAGAMLPPVLERLPIEAVRCYFEPDGSFPNHEPNPLLPENREFIVRKTLEEGADLGVAFDGDADRCFFVDDTRRVRPRRLRDRALRRERAREGARARRSSTTCARAGRCRDTIERGRRHRAREPRRPRVHQGADAQGGRRLRRRGLRPLLLPRLQPGRLGRRPVPAHARADLEERPALSEILAPLRERYFITGEINTPVPDVALKLQELKERYAGRPRLAPRRDLGRLRRLALQRPPLEHRAAAAPQPRGDVGGADGGEARRGARGDPLVSGEYAFVTRTRVGFSDTDAQGVVYYGRYNPYFDLARDGVPSLARPPPSGGRRRVRDARERRRVLRAGPLRRRARDPHPRRADRADEHDLRVRGVQGAGGDAAGHRAPDARLHRPRDAPADPDPRSSTGSRSMSADADEQLRQTVAELAAREDCAWAGIFFVEEDSARARARGRHAGSRTAHHRPRACGATRGSPSSRPTATVAPAEPRSRRAEHRRPLPRRLGHRRRGCGKADNPSLVRGTDPAPPLACPSNGVTRGW